MKIALVCSHGGHLTEAMQLLDAFKGHEFFFVVPHSTRDAELANIAPVVFSKYIDVNPFKFIVYFFWALVVLRRERPKVILSTGPENAIPFFFWGKLLGIKTIYIELWCRVENLSITGNIVYHWVDEFWVQWPQLQVLYPRTKYKGSVV